MLRVLGEAMIGPVGTMGWPWIPDLKVVGVTAVQGLLAQDLVAVLGLCLLAFGWGYMGLRVDAVISLSADAQQ